MSERPASRSDPAEAVRGGPLRRIAIALWLALRVQVRGGFLYAYALVTATAIGVLRFALPEDWLPTALPIFLLAEPGILGVQLVGAQVYLERVQKSDQALLTTHLRPVERLLALTACTAAIAAIAGAVTVAGAMGPSTRVPRVMPPLFLCTLLTGLVGFWLTLRHGDFQKFVMASIPWLLVLHAPVLAVLGAAGWWMVAWVPTTPAMLAFVEIANPESASTSKILGATFMQLVSVGVVLVWVVRAQRAAHERGEPSA